VPVLIERLALVLPGEVSREAGESGVRIAGAVSEAGDGELAVLSFDAFGPMRAAIEDLAVAGFGPTVDGEPGDVAVVDQRAGPALWWPWLELAVAEAPGGGRVLSARLAGSGRRDLVTPAGWSYAGSASERFGVPPLRPCDRPLRHLRREEGPVGHADVYVDRWTGEEVRLRRAGPRHRVRVRGPGGEGEVRADVVSRGEEIEVGLMFRRALSPDEGMLFRFPVARRHGFWMKNTLVPLDILFVGPGGRVVTVAREVEPMRMRSHGSTSPVREVLEVPGGWCAAHGIGEGATVEIVA
jgi:hypothetical protein